MRVQFALMLRTFLVFVLVVTTTSPDLIAQSRKQVKKRSPVIFDEFGSLGYCDATARLDNFAIQLQNSPGYQGYLIVYAPPESGPRILEAVKNYLVNSRGLEDEKISTIYAGRNNVLSEPRVQLWLTPSVASPPQPEKYETKPEVFKGKLFEREGWDEIPSPGVGAEGEGLPLGVAYDAFEDVFKHQPNSVAYVVAYNGRISTPGAWRRVAESEVEELKKPGFDSSRFKIIYGGDVKELKFQVWIQPASDPPPVKEAGPEASPTKTIQVGDYEDYELGYDKFERQAFNRLLETLRSFPKLKACLIIRIASAGEREEEETTQETLLTADVMNQEGESFDEPEELEPEPADVLQLAEKWKTEFANRHHIREDRLVVLFSKAQPGLASSLETWIIPPGQPLPDPEAVTDVQEESGEKAPLPATLQTSTVEPKAKPANKP